MSCSRPRLSRLFVSAVMAVAAGVILAPPIGVAREGHRINHETDIPVLSAPTRQGFNDIIVQMAPLRPAPGAVAAKAAPAPGVARETTPAPVVEASKDSAAPKDAAKTEPARPQTARTDGRPELRTGEPAMPTAPAVAQAAKPAAQPLASVAQHEPVARDQGSGFEDRRGRHAGQGRDRRSIDEARRSRRRARRARSQGSGFEDRRSRRCRRRSRSPISRRSASSRFRRPRRQSSDKRRRPLFRRPSFRI